MEFKDVITDPAQCRELRAPPPCVAKTIAIMAANAAERLSVVFCEGETS